jgi:hypothetical protein
MATSPIAESLMTAIFGCFSDKFLWSLVPELLRRLSSRETLALMEAVILLCRLSAHKIVAYSRFPAPKNYFLF